MPNGAESKVFRIVQGERFTPFSLARKLGARVLLESASFRKGRERYSFLMLRDAFTVFQKDGGVFMNRDGKVLSLKSTNGDILDVLLYFANQHRGTRYEFPMLAGGVGYLSYEYARRFDTVRLNEGKPDFIGVPEAAFIFGHIFLVFDHYTDTISILGVNYREHEIDLESAVREVETHINDLNFNYMAPPSREYVSAAITADEDRPQYCEGVKKVRTEIIEGNLLQGVLSRRVYVKTDMPALDAYKNLRSYNPSPYMFYLDFGPYQLLGSSPEVHVRVKDGRAVVRPIAGTRRRGRNRDEDLALERELLCDEKELAEHLMLVDLARNDLGRICKPGTVKVTESRVIERYSHVMHIVSQVEGDLRGDRSGIDAIRATFPAGTVSGAPKIRAMEVIDSLEKEKRSFYAGIVGYVEPDGNLDTCITIRSALKKQDLLILQAGAGIVYDSVPEREYQETSAKLSALQKAIGLEV